MACTQSGIVLLLVIVMTGMTSAKLGLQVDISKPKSNVGDSVTVKCQVTNEEKKSIFIVWVKKVGTEEVEIGTNTNMNAPFVQTGRYSGQVKLAAPDDISNATFYLYINDVQPSDSGEIGCTIPQENLEVFDDLIVQVPFASLDISSRHLDGTHHVTYGDGETITFNEGEKRNFNCRATGGYPKPEMSITLGDQEIPELFNTSLTLGQEGTDGLKELLYTIEMANPQLEIAYNFNKKKLECSANIPGTPFKANKSINIELTGYKPQFFCDNVKYVALHEEDVSLTCKVIADPPINGTATSYYWHRKSAGNDSIIPGEMLGQITASLESGETQFENIVSLSIDHVYSQHFRTYYFEVTNELGTVTHGVDLIMEPNYNVDTDPPTEGMPWEEEVPGDKDGIGGATALQVTAGLVVTSLLTLLLA